MSLNVLLVIQKLFWRPQKHVCKLDKAQHIEVSVIITVDEAIFIRRRREFSATSLYQQQHNNKEQMKTAISNKFGFVSLHEIRTKIFSIYSFIQWSDKIIIMDRCIGDLRAFLETTKHVCKLDKARHIEVSVIIRLDEAIFFQRGREFLPLLSINNSYVD